VQSLLDKGPSLDRPAHEPFIILTVSDVERSLKFYTAALKPLKITMFMPYKGEDGHPDLWGFGDGQKAFFWLKQGKPDPASIHWGFIAETIER
jgi:catechol 2,3-dioxygenase-like lactoylglutathione lyase family enzyme